jgi:DNA modification methylase
VVAAVVAQPEFGTLLEPEGEASGFTDGQLLEDWIAPPFSVLDTRQGYWKDRREKWLSLGITSELGRGEDLLDLTGARQRQDAYKAALSTPGRVGEGGMADALARSLEKGSGNYRSDYGVYQPGRGSSRREADERSNLTGAASLPAYADFGTALVAPGTSIFDPVLCELVYRWWCPAGGHVLDPFAGGSVRGIVAAKLGHPYTGVDLSARQVEANREQAAKILGPSDPVPEWIVGDSRHLAELLPAGQAFDLVFTCPPYYDLEVYSDDPADLSNMPWDDFVNGYYQVIEQAVQMLRPNRFAAWVIGDIRDRKTGHLRNLHGLTTEAFEAAGAAFYNDAILQTPVGTLAVRSGAAKSGFGATRKIGRRHQYVLVYVKGDSREAVKALDEHVDELPT